MHGTCDMWLFMLIQTMPGTCIKLFIKRSKDVIHKVILHYFITRIPFQILQNTLTSKLVKHELMPPVQNETRAMGLCATYNILP